MFGIFVMFISIETAIVAALPLFSELLPQARAVMMSANVGAHALGRVAGAALGAGVYKFSDGNFLLIGLIAGGLGIVAFFVMLRLVPDGGQRFSPPTPNPSPKMRAGLHNRAHLVTRPLPSMRRTAAPKPALTKLAASPKMPCRCLQRGFVCLNL